MLSELATTASRDIHDLISQTADVYQEAALLAVSSSSAAYHARFLRALVAKDAESKLLRQLHRHSGQSSRNSPDHMDEDPSPSRGTQSVYSPVHPHPNGRPSHAGTNSQATSPQYATFPAAAISHNAPPPHLPQMSPTETKPSLIYRPPPHHAHPQPNGTTSTATYSHSHYGSVDYSHPHAVTGHHPPMVVQYPAAVIPAQSVSTNPSELDMRYSRSLLQELGYPSMSVEPVGEWFTQAMGPSSCAGLI